MTANFDRHKAIFGGAASNSFSLVNTRRSLDLIAPSPEVFRVWYEGLKQVLKNVAAAKSTTSIEDQFVKDVWDAADKDGSGTLTKAEVITAVAQLNINKPRAEIIAIYKSVDTDNNGTLNFVEFCSFIEILRERCE